MQNKPFMGIVLATLVMAIPLGTEAVAAGAQRNPHVPPRRSITAPKDQLVRHPHCSARHLFELSNDWEVI